MAAGKQIAPTKKAAADVVQSKTARVSTRNRAKEEAFKASPDMNRIVSLANGEFAYLMDPRDGKTHHLATDSQEWAHLIEDLLKDPTHGPRIEAELNSMRRSKIYDRFVALNATTEDQSV